MPDDLQDVRLRRGSHPNLSLRTLNARSTTGADQRRLQGIQEAERPCRLDLSVPHWMCRNLRRWQANLGLGLGRHERADT